MKVVTQTLNNDPVDVRVEVFGDLHIGSKKCDMKQIKDRIKFVAEHDNVYAIILGDVVNNSTKQSVGDVFEEVLTPMQQIKTAIELFAPIKDKILCGVSGNHERRSYKYDGIDLLQFMFAELGISERYDSCACLLFVKTGKNGHKGARYKASHNSKNLGQMTYTIYCTHGDGSNGKTIGGKANNLSKRADIIDADVIVTGHTHQSIIFDRARYAIDTRHSTYSLVTQLCVNIASTLDYEEYAEICGMAPTSKNCPYLVLDGTEFKASAHL